MLSSFSKVFKRLLIFLLKSTLNAEIHVDVCGVGSLIVCLWIFFNGSYESFSFIATLRPIQAYFSVLNFISCATDADSKSSSLFCRLRIPQVINNLKNISCTLQFVGDIGLQNRNFENSCTMMVPFSIGLTKFADNFSKDSVAGS